MIDANALTRRQEMDIVVKDGQMAVLSKVRSGKSLDWLEKSVLADMLGHRIGMCDKVSSLLQEMKERGELGDDND